MNTAVTRVSGFLLPALVLIVVGVANAWAVLAFYFDVSNSALRIPLAAGYGAGILATLLWVPRPWKQSITATAAAVVALAWWFALKPSNHRDWQPDVAVLPYGEVAGNLVTLHNIRDCDYRSPSDYDVRRYDRTFDLDRLRTVDLFMVHWGSPDIAHPMISFGFDDDEHVCVSIETRKAKGEEYSAFKGFFRHYELTYVFADERDVVRLRTNYRRDEEVYLYRLRATSAQARALFLDYVRRAGELRETPEWYHAISSNCTTAIRTQRAVADRMPWDWRMLVNGRLDALLYERGLIDADTRMPFAAVKSLALINEKARAADRAPDFSRRIRDGIGPSVAR